MADQPEESGENPPEESTQELERGPSDEAAAAGAPQQPDEQEHYERSAGPSLLDIDEDEAQDVLAEPEELEEYELDDENNPMAVLPDYVFRRVDKLLDLNLERDKIMEDYLKERAALEAKYHSLCEPLYEKRLQIVRGDHDAAIAKESGTEDEAADAGETAVGVPQFWVCAMGHMEAVAENVTEEDVNCLEHLQNVTCEDDPEGTGFTLRFHFTPNDYFEDTVLTKRYEVPNLLLADEPILKNVEGCKIRWKEGKSLTHRTVKKKQRGKGKNSGQIRTVTKKERKESFFHFFEPPKMPSMEDMDEEQADQLEDFFDSDYDMAQAFRSHIIPKAALWFTGRAMAEEMAQMVGDEDLAVGTGSGSTRLNPFPPSVPGEQPPECQQN